MPGLAFVSDTDRGALLWLTQGMAHRVLLLWLGLSDSVCLQVYRTFLCVDLSVPMDEDTSQVSSIHSLMKECMPCAPEREGCEPMHSDSSVKQKKWLLAAPGATWCTPTLFRHLKECSCTCIQYVLSLSISLAFSFFTHQNKSGSRLRLSNSSLNTGQ